MGIVIEVKMAAQLLSDNRHAIFGLALAASSGLAVYSTYKLIKLRHGAHGGHHHHSEEEEDPIRNIEQWLSNHYGHESILTIEGVDYGPKIREATKYAQLLAAEVMANYKDQAGIPSRVLDVGCAVGGTCFELARKFHRVVGLDSDQALIDACNQLKNSGSMDYTILVEGDIRSTLTARRPDKGLNVSNVEFMVGDACSLPGNLGQFGCVIISETICFLEEPLKFLEQMTKILPAGGLLVIADSYTSYGSFFGGSTAAKEKWLGGYLDADGNPVLVFDTLKKQLAPSFDLIKEKEIASYRRNDNGRILNSFLVHHVTFWQRKN